MTQVQVQRSNVRVFQRMEVDLGSICRSLPSASESLSQSGPRVWGNAVSTLQHARCNA